MSSQKVKSDGQANDLGLSVVYEPPQGVVAQVDIVSIHGLNGSPRKTWTFKGDNQEIMWPRDLLPQGLPTARVMTFGYDVKIINSKLSACLDDHARGLIHELANVRSRGNPNESTRPLIFICHSLGGLLIKEALCFASGKDATSYGFNEIFESTWGIIFMGTPHRGAKLGEFSSLIYRSQPLNFLRSTNMVNFLQLNAKHLLDLQQRFLAIANRFIIKSFYELGVIGLSKVVERESAVLFIPGGNARGQEQQIPLEFDHRAMCRYASFHDAAFQKVLVAIKDILKYGDSEKRRPPISSKVLAESLITVRNGTKQQDWEETQNLDSPRQGHDHGTVSLLPDTLGGKEFDPGAHHDTQVTVEELMDYLQGDVSFGSVQRDLVGIEDAAEGTCRWIQKLPEYSSWVDARPEVSTLLLTGKMGSGKSVITKDILLSRLPQKGHQSDQSSSNLVIYYFCSRVKRSDDSAQRFLKALIYQLARHHPMASKVDLGAEAALAQEIRSWSVKQLWKLFDRLLRDCTANTLYCFIDAIDECEDSSIDDFLKYFRDFCKPKVTPQFTKIRFFITRRSTSSVIYPGFRDVRSLFHIPITPKNVQEDIHSMVRFDVENIIQHMELGEEEEQKLGRELALRAKGMFQWAKFVVAEIRQMQLELSFDDILLKIKDLSVGLKEIYTQSLSRLWERMSIEKRELARKILAWVLLAYRPLTIEEMIMAMSVTEGMQNIPRRTKQKTSIASFIATHLSPLIEIVKEDGEKVGEGQTGSAKKDASTIRPIHDSVRQFLWNVCIDPNRDIAKRAGYYIGESAGHEIIVRTGFAYLRCRELQLEFKDIGEFEADELGRIAFKPEMEKSIVDFLSDPKHILFEYWSKNMWNHLRSTGHGALDVVRFLLESGADYNAKDKWGHTPLARVLQGRHSETAKLILQFNPDLAILDQSGFQSIDIAVDAQDYELVKLLLQQNSPRGARDEPARISTPLYWAALRGHVPIIRLLVEAGAWLEGRSDDGEPKQKTPLHAAAGAGKVEAIRVLHELGADLEARSANGHTPLIWAYVCNQVEAEEVLLECGANPYVLAKEYRWDYRWYSSVLFEGRSLAQILRKVDSAPSSQTLPEGTPDEGALIRAVTNGKLEDFRKFSTIVDQDINKKFADGRGYTLLHIASGKGHTAIVTELLERGADPNSKGPLDATPMHTAALYGHTETLKVLIYHGATVDAITSRFKCTALLVAADGRHKSFVQCLLENGARADGDIEDATYYISPLHVSVARRKSKATEILLHKGASVNRPDYRGETPLTLAIGFDDNFREPKIVKCLVENGASLDTADPSEVTPLQVAAKFNDSEYLNIMLASQTAPTYENQVKALALAVQSGRRQNVKLLLDHMPRSLSRADLRSFVPHGDGDRGDKLKLADIEDPVAATWEYLCQSGIGHELASRLISSHLAEDVCSSATDIGKVCLVTGAIYAGRLDLASEQLSMGFGLRLSRAEAIPISRHMIDIKTSGELGLHLTHEKRLGALELLIEERLIDPHDTDDSGWSIADCCAKRGTIEMAAALMEKGVDFSRSLEHAIGRDKDSYEMVQKILEYKGPDYCLDMTQMAHWAIPHALKAGNLLVTELLVTTSGPIYMESLTKEAVLARKLLTSAAASDKEEVLQWLLKYLKDDQINRQDHKGNTVVHDAASTSGKAVMTVLLDHGGDLTILNNFGWSPIFVATAAQNIPACEAIAYHASWDSAHKIDAWGRTPLHVAAQYGNLKIAGLLRLAGILPSADANGWYPKDVAVQEGHQDTFVAAEVDPLQTATDVSTEFQQPSRFITMLPEHEDFFHPIVHSKGQCDVHLREHVPPRSSDLVSDSPRAYQARSDYCIPPNIDEYYFEIEFLEDRPSGFIAIGLATEYRPEFDKECTGDLFAWYHWLYDVEDFDDDEVRNLLCGRTAFTKGDRLGCGVDFQKRSMFFTLNSLRLRTSVEVFHGALYPLIMLGGPGTHVRAKLNLPTPSRMEADQNSPRSEGDKGRPKIEGEKSSPRIEDEKNNTSKKSPGWFKKPPGTSLRLHHMLGLIASTLAIFLYWLIYH